MHPVGLNSISVEWGMPEFNGGAPLEGYNIAIKDIKKTMWMEVARVRAGVQKYTIRDLQADQEYLVRIFARNEVGLSTPLESDDPFKVVPATDGKSNILSGILKQSAPLSEILVDIL